MEQYVGLDVSLKLTAICIVDRTGKIEREGVVASDLFVRSHAPHVARVGLETGATSTWLWTELNKLGLPVICIDARHAKAVLKMQINKSDRNDAVGIARIMQCGWYKEVRVKDLDSHAIKALLVSRENDDLSGDIVPNVGNHHSTAGANACRAIELSRRLQWSSRHSFLHRSLAWARRLHDPRRDLLFDARHRRIDFRRASLDRTLASRNCARRQFGRMTGELRSSDTM